jgi:hypothetical protein
VFLIYKYARTQKDGACAAHDQYADEQLQNMQKRIFFIEFLRLCFVIVYQMNGCARINNTAICRVFYYPNVSAPSYRHTAG